MAQKFSQTHKMKSKHSNPVLFFGSFDCFKLIRANVNFHKGADGAPC